MLEQGLGVALSSQVVLDKPCFLQHVLTLHVLLWLFVGSVTVGPAVASRDKWVLFESLWKTPANCQNQMARGNHILGVTQLRAEQGSFTELPT